MFCTKCGAANSGEAVYCQKCGRLLEAEEETRVALRQKSEILVNTGAESDTDDGGERQIFSITPTMMFVKVGYLAAIVGAFLLVILLSFFAQLIPAWVSVLLGLSLLLIPAFYHFRHKMVRYTLTDSKVEIDEGLVSRKTRSIPLRRIQDVTVSATVPQRLLGFGDLIIDNASEDGEKIVLKNINSPKKYADILLKQMRLLER